MKITYISWAPHCTRSDSTARELGGRSFMVYRGWLGSRALTVPLKYALQAWDTWSLLWRERPDAVFVMTPPVFAPLVVAGFCAARRIPFVIDAHSSAFLDRRWRHFQGLQRWLCRRAATTIVHNAATKAYVERMPARATLVPDVPVEFGPGTYPVGPSFGHAFSAAAVCSFNWDEPVDALVEAARLVPDLRLFITGDGSRMKPALRAALPSNVVLTGFLSLGDYGALLQGVDVVVALTTRADTSLRSAFEAVYQGTPVIVSDSSVLRAAFPMGALHVANEGPAIAAALERLREDRPRFRADAQRLGAQMRERWHATRDSIESALDAAPRAKGAA